MLACAECAASDDAGGPEPSDQIPGTEATTRLEFKVGRLAANDDFDKNRYSGSTRTEFMNWSLWDNTAWDYAANTRGYTDGVVIGYVSPNWSLKYGVYRMPENANGQTLVGSFKKARGENLEVTAKDFRLPIANTWRRAVPAFCSMMVA